MTTYLPTLCRACARAFAPSTADGGTSDEAPSQCAAYPRGIPLDIALFGEDHHQLRGDEVTPLTFVQATNPASVQAFRDWRAMVEAGG